MPTDLLLSLATRIRALLSLSRMRHHPIFIWVISFFERVVGDVYSMLPCDDDGCCRFII